MARIEAVKSKYTIVEIDQTTFVVPSSTRELNALVALKKTKQLLQSAVLVVENGVKVKDRGVDHGALLAQMS